MSKQHEPRRPRGGRTRLSGIPAPSGTPSGNGGGNPMGNQMAFSGLVHRALLSFGERDQQRRRLLNILVLVQALLLVASAPAYLGSNPTVPGLVVVGCGLVLYLAAWAFNQAFQDAVRATYLLVVGGGVVVLAQVFLAASTGRDAINASFAALLLLTILLDAGLLFLPEMTGLIASVGIALSAVGLVLAVTLGPAATQQQTYVTIATVLGLQVATALIAWLLSRFIADTAVEAERTHALQIAQVRLNGITTQTAEQRRRIEASAAALRDTINRVLAGDGAARAEPLDGELGALAVALNQLLERQESAGVGGGFGQRFDATIGAVGDLAGAEAGASPVQADLARRLVRIREVAGEVLGGLTHGEQGLASTAQAASESLRTVGASLAAADALLTAAQKTSELTSRARRALAGMLPGEGADSVAGEPQGDASGPLNAAQAAALLGLGPDLGVGGPGLTGEFTALLSADGDGQGEENSEASPAASAPASASNGSHSAASAIEGADASTPAKRRKGQRSLTGDMVQRLNDVGHLLAQLHDEAANQERGATALTHELGLTNRHARGVDVGVAWARQALEAIRRNAQRLYQTAGGTVSPFPGGAGNTYAVGPAGDLPARAPMPTRPLVESGKLSALVESVETLAAPEAKSVASREDDAVVIEAPGAAETAPEAPADAPEEASQTSAE